MSEQAEVTMVTLTVNGTTVTEPVEPRTLLSDFLRHQLGLTGTHVGCEQGVCGACTVLVDGEAVVSCLVPFTQVDGCSVETIEGTQAQALQRAFMDHIGAQCGICTPGMILAAMSLGADPTRKQMQEALAGNLCRCTGYEAIFRAIRAAKRASRTDAQRAPA